MGVGGYDLEKVVLGKGQQDIRFLLFYPMLFWVWAGSAALTWIQKFDFFVVGRMADVSQVPWDRNLSAMDREGREDGLVLVSWLMACLTPGKDHLWFECGGWTWLQVWGGVGVAEDLESPGCPE